jgi:hypothetical protein
VTISNGDSPEKTRVSRRGFLGGAAAGGGAMLGIGLIGSRAAAASAKVSPQTVNYQPKPNGNARCGTCAFFEAPSGCKFVQGAVTPAGWCMLYRPKG